jgi:arylsulfatase A-like enzyme
MPATGLPAGTRSLRLKEIYDVDRTSLPIPDKPYAGPVYEDAKDPRAVYEPIRSVEPPQGAPNVLVILLDDVGFGAASAFGGPCRTPNAERLASNGLSYSRFHTAALCAPTRQALLTGRNHHAVGMGAITEIATSIPGYTSVRPHSAAPLAEVLRLNGYATAQFGKCHEVPVWQTSPVGPFDAWPTGGGGFEHFFGFLGGETNQYAPALYSGTTPIEPDRSADEGYHFTEDMTDRAIAWMRQQTALTPDRPFFMYYAPGATHAPHHVPLEWADRYRGDFDDGWDALRERTFAEQKRRGIVPEDAELTRRHEEIPAWDDMPDELKPVLARQMEVYAGFLEHTDHHIGRLVDALDAVDSLENTLVFYILGDNGASAEGHINGSFNEYLFFNGAAALETPEFLASRVDKLGTPEAYNHFSVGWAHAMDTPYQWTKQVASHWGGTRNATVVHWPRGISERGQVRHQFHHVIDIAPTVLDVAGLPHPAQVNGVEQDPLHGVSMRYSFDEGQADDHHTTQYFEIGGNRGIYHEGWTAVTKHATPWVAMAELPAFADDVWELYAPGDWTQSSDLAAQLPEKLSALQDLFLSEARRYNVLPLDDRRVERFDADVAGRPQLVTGRSQLLFGGMSRLTEATVINIKNVSHAVAADVVVPEGGGSGVIVAQGGAFGGWSLYLRTDGVPVYCYNLMGMQSTKVVGSQPLAPGRRRVVMLFDYDGGGPGRGGSVTLKVDGQTVGEGRLERTVPLVFSLDETCDVGRDGGLPVSDDYRANDSEFTGTVESVLIEIDDGAADFSHLVDPQLRLSVALARQ